ncbi:hypothetical protein RFI_27747, partial [Reticulomyxa filosa]
MEVELDLGPNSSEELELASWYERGKALSDVNPNEATKWFEKILLEKDDKKVEENAAIKERAIYELVEIYTKAKNIGAIKKLFIDVKPYFNTISKAKTGKIVRSIIEKMSNIENALEAQIELCRDCIEWCEQENRNLLKQQIETKLSEYYLESKKYQLALQLIGKVTKDVKKIDDKHLLVEVHLIESRIQHALRNIPKAKAALTACRAAANSIYIGPLMQAQVDMQAGRLSNEERDYKTSFSYFYEAFEGFDGLKDSRAPLALKYMLLSKIMNGMPGDVTALITGKLALKYTGRSIDAMKAVADAYKQSSLQRFEEVVTRQYRPEIEEDIVVSSKLQELSDKLLEQNLSRLLEPFDRVEISHIAKLIDLPLEH